MEKITIGLASDHAGFALKEALADFLLGKGYGVRDFGCRSAESCDYPDFGHPLAASVASGEVQRGIAVCSTGNGINMSVNRHNGVRGALCLNEEMARLARNHNNANICTFAAKYTSIDEAKKIAEAFLVSGFEGGRHERRVEKIELSPSDPCR